MQITQEKQNLIYLYDLPRDEVDSKKIAMVFESQAKVVLENRPQIRKDITRQFYSAIVNIKDDLQFHQACEKMRYFEIDGKPCRALQFDRQLLGTNKEKLMQQNVFVRNIPKECKHEDLQKKFEEYGKIKSLKISLNDDHSSRGYGFVCFDDEHSATRAVDKASLHQDSIPIKFQPRERRHIRKLVNNVYVKNIPVNMTEEDVRKMFSEFGHIKSLVLQKHEFGQFGFVCFDDPSRKNTEYGPECAQKAIEGLKDKDMGDGRKLYLRHALKKTDREIEKKRDIIRYKTSKKRCNLYVKNFPAGWNEEDIENLFKEYGTIEKIKLQTGSRDRNFAFVCFTSPDNATAAKQSLNNMNVEGRPLLINHYEIKEYREIQVQDAIDKADFEKYMAQKLGTSHSSDWQSHPNIAQILQQLLEIMQQNQQMTASYNNHERHKHLNTRQYNRRPQYHYDRNRQFRNNNNNQGQQQQQHNHHAQMQPPQPITPVGAPPLQSSTEQPTPGGAGANNQNVLTVQGQYWLKTQKIIPSITEKNKFLKEQVGQVIFPFIQNMLQYPTRTPKITGMLIELPVEQIKQYMLSYEALQSKVHEANALIDQAEQSQGKMG